MNGKLVYIASPCRPYGCVTMEENLDFARACCHYAISRGYTPIAPHLLYTQFLDDSCDEERRLGMSAGEVLLLHCDELWVCGDIVSDGMKQEILCATKNGIQITNLPKVSITGG